MNRAYADAHYTTRFVEDIKDGFSGLELFRDRAAKNERVARILFWDASGQFYFETFNTDLPLMIVEEFIAEAKELIVTQ